MTDRVLVTGATGFAGGFVLEHYLARGWEVTGTRRATSRSLAEVAGVAWREVDLGDSAAVLELVAAERPHVVIHLAAQSSVSASWTNPLSTLETNARLQHNVLQAVAALCPSARVLVVGSSDEYGNVAPEENPIGEGHPLRPFSPYGLSKVVQDLMAEQFVWGQRLAVVRVRPFLQLGPRRTPRFVAGSFARQVAEIAAGLREPHIEVGNLDLVRDFTDVRDAVRAYALVAEKAAPGAVYNIASGEGRTIREMLTIMLESTGVRAEIRQEQFLRRGKEPPVLVGDASRLQTDLGWRREISFDQSAADTVDYWRQQVQDATIQEEVQA